MMNSCLFCVFFLVWSAWIKKKQRVGVACAYAYVCLEYRRNVVALIQKIPEIEQGSVQVFVTTVRRVPGDVGPKITNTSQMPVRPTDCM